MHEPQFVPALQRLADLLDRHEPVAANRAQQRRAADREARADDGPALERALRRAARENREPIGVAESVAEPNSVASHVRDGSHFAVATNTHAWSASPSTLAPR